MGAERWVMEVLRVGHRIPFMHPPLLSLVPIEYSSYSHDSEKERALNAEIVALVEKAALESAEERPG